ncbi:CapA family protein [Candidatus Saccharibacteria bacterium]|nr:CapA family protein [Candidatus Saccharibacteria bacterium]
MSRGNKSVGTRISIFVLFFIFMFVGVFFGVQFITKTGVFRVPGVVYYGESLSSDEKAKLEEIFSYQTDLDKDVTISAKNVLEAPNLKEGEYIYNIYVPVTDFYSTKTNLTINSVEEIFDPTFQAANEFELIPISELDFTKKLLSLNDKYYLDELVSGAVYRIVSFESEKFAEEIKPLVTNTFSVKAPTKDTLLTFAQTGVTALSRGMNAKLNAVGGDATYFAEGIKDFLSAFDITHTSNESSFTDYASSSNICSDKRFIDTLTAIGLDVVELTGNHNQDCGDTAALETIDTYIANGIKMVGGGKTATEAALPLELSKKGSNITMLAFNQSTGGATYDDTPGANQYYEEVAAEQIKEAKARGDLVIVDIQYYECSAYASEYEDPTCDRANSSAGDQIGLFHHLIDLGADVVVGTSAHQAQTYELYGDGVIYYGLGNLFFDQIWWPGTTRSLVLAHYIYNGKLLQTKLVGTVYDKNMQTGLLDDETLAWWLDRLISVRP